MAKTKGSETGAYVALLRAVNVGGNNKLPMAALVEIFEDAGCSDVRTYIASGNVVFSATRAGAERAPRAVMKAILGRFGFEAPVVVRSAAEMAAVAVGNPYLARGIDEKALHVSFLADAPDKAKVGALDAARSPGDSFSVKGREIYLNLGGGMGVTKLTNTYFEKVLGTASTARNWRTVLKLVEMSSKGPV